MDDLLDRVTTDLAINHARPVIRSVRYPVETPLELLSSGMTNDEVLTDYNNLEQDDLLAAMALPRG